MSDIFHSNTHGISDDDMDMLMQIASAHLRQGEDIFEIRRIGADKVKIDVGIIINKKAGSGRTVSVEKIAGNWTVMEVQGWIA